MTNRKLIDYKDGVNLVATGEYFRRNIDENVDVGTLDEEIAQARWNLPESVQQQVR